MTPLSPNQRIVLQLLAEAAAAGAPCPTNAALAVVLGASSVATPARIVEALDGRGLIAVERRASSRRISVPAVGRWTAWSRDTVAARPAEVQHGDRGVSWERIVAMKDAAAQARADYVGRLLDEEQRKYGLARRGRPLAEMPA